MVIESTKYVYVVLKKRIHDLNIINENINEVVEGVCMPTDGTSKVTEICCQSLSGTFNLCLNLFKIKY